MKQTAVEWLLQQMDLETISKYDKQLLQAKTMEKQQIMEAFKHGELPPLFVNFDADQYYNETFNKDK